MESGPQLMLIQLLPSSTVAAGVRLKTGLGTVASEMPGGTCHPPPAVVFSGGMRDPLQYCRSSVGAAAVLLALYPAMLVITENVGLRVTVEAWLVGPVSPRTPMSQ